MVLEPQLVDGALSSGSGSLDNLAGKLDDFSKNQKLRMASAGGDVGSTILRDGSHLDELGNLKPNVKYQAGEHNYLYQTDGQGRILKAHADDLQLKLHDGRLRHNSKTLDKQVGDHAGHIFGDLFGGSPELDNLVSQAKNVNQSGYRRIEKQWENALKSTPPKKVEVDIKINYDGISKRPTGFEVNYKIDGKPYKEILRNINIR